MSARRIIILGNAGSGKATLARRTSRLLSIPRLDLDAIAWEAPAVRREMGAALALLGAFVAENPEWVIDGCYGDLVAEALPRCSELWFLNPGVEACVENCRARPWEPSKFRSKSEQDAMLGARLDWVRQYETRDDEYGLSRHRAVFDGFRGRKKEYRTPPP